MIKKLRIKVNRVNNGIFHDTRSDVHALAKVCNELIDKVNELTDEINELNKKFKVGESSE